MNPTSHISIIGTGKVGTSLAEAMQSTGHSVSLIGRDKSAQMETVRISDIVLLTVQDSQIADLCHSLADAFVSNTVVAHCSGVHGVEVLADAKSVGCHVASAHPLNTFPTLEASRRLLSNKAHNTTCFISGDEHANTVLHDLFASIGFITKELSDNNKVAYHAACVFACNYLTCLSELSLLTAEHAGLNRDEFWQAVQPIISATLDNITEAGTAQALSGPIARGDAATVQKHLLALESASPQLSSAYRILGQQAVELAKQRDELSENQISKLEENLK